MPTVSEAFDRALNEHQAGRLQSAEEIYRQILSTDPNHADAWNLLGVLNAQSGNPQAAVELISRAIGLAGNVAAYHNNLGNVLQSLERWDDAIKTYRRALELKPHYAEAHHNLGNVWQAKQVWQEAAACYRRAIEVSPDFVEAHHNLGRALQAEGDLIAAALAFQRATELRPDFAEAQLGLANAQQLLGNLDVAVASYRRTVELNPDLAEAHNNLGNALKDLGQLEVAAACYRRTIELQPNLAAAHDNLANVLKELGQRDEAESCYRRALALDPNFAEASTNLGVLLKDQGRLEEAVACYLRALELKPAFAKASNNLGNALREQKQLEAAIAAYRSAIDLEPEFADAHFNLGNVLQELDRGDEAVASHRRAIALKPDYAVAMSALVHELQHLCEWEDVRELSERVIGFVENKPPNKDAGPVSPFSLLTLPTITTARQQLLSAEQWVAARLKSPAAGPRGSVMPRTAQKSKIVVGYLSADFHSHATARLIVELFEKHDRRRFMTIGYSFGHNDGSPMRRRLAAALDQFVDIRHTSFAEAAEQIAADGVDIAVDLKGYTMDSREEILSLRPAPIQVSYLGYPGTMGAPFMDYILVDPFVVPADQQPYYAENLVHLPDCYQVNDSKREISPRTPSRAECGLPAAGMVFCSFNNNYKITSEVFSVWMRLLAAVPGSVLWLLEGNRFAPGNLRREAVARGIDAERLVFAPRLPLAEHLARHRNADLFLDTFPVNAHTTASEALWAGCPVLTIAGNTFISRVAGSLLHAVGLPELVTTSLVGYERLALQLANDPKQLTELRSRLAVLLDTSFLFDGEVFARHIEQAFETMWQIHVAGERPRPFAVGKG